MQVYRVKVKKTVYGDIDVAAPNAEIAQAWAEENTDSARWDDDCDDCTVEDVYSTALDTADDYESIDLDWIKTYYNISDDTVAAIVAERMSKKNRTAA